MQRANEGGIPDLPSASLFDSRRYQRSNGYEILQALADSASAFGKGFSVASQAWRTHAEQQGMMASHIRRRDEWAFQSNQTLKELQQSRRA